MNLSHTLKKEIEFLAPNVYKNTKFFQLASNGSLTVLQIRRYVKNLRFLFQSTYQLIMLAENEARKNNNLELAEFFSEKKDEEEGHEHWASEDLNQLGDPEADTVRSKINPATIYLVKELKGLIKKDPKFFIIYMFYARNFRKLWI